jgi:hypothetical protein
MGTAYMKDHVVDKIYHHDGFVERVEAVDRKEKDIGTLVKNRSWCGEKFLLLGDLM